MKINKFILSLVVMLLVVSLALGLSGCGSDGSESQDSGNSEVTSTAQAPGNDEAGKADKVLKVALITEGPVSDAGWNASAYDGLIAIQTELGAEISNLETKSPSEYEEGMRSYASQGYDIIFAHGFQFQDAAQNVV